LKEPVPEVWISHAEKGKLWGEDGIKEKKKRIRSSKKGEKTWEGAFEKIARGKRAEMVKAPGGGSTNGLVMGKNKSQRKGR